jgi:DNA-binding SARP family transcriptional activator/tetratricopeptide (TPR) repeat protein
MSPAGPDAYGGAWGDAVERSSRLLINLLGELTASYDGHPLDLGGRRQRAVLARLLVARGDTVPADSLADAVWGEQAPRDVSGALQAYVSHLRRGLHPGVPARARTEVLVRQGTGYALRHVPEDVDAWRFEDLLRRAEQAPAAEAVPLLTEGLALWRGPALVEYADEPWAEAEVARLTELRTLARERLLAARLDVEDAGLLVPELEGLVADEPLREERWRLLALALYRAHRQADALAALRRARDTLAEELGVDPGPALRKLEAEVLAQAPSLAAPARAVAPDQGPQRGALPTGRRSVPRGPHPGPDPLVERDDETAALEELLDGLGGGHPGLVVVEGPAGLGKTRLLHEAQRLAAARSVRVLSARGSQLESSFAYGVVRQLFDPELADASRAESLLAGSAAGARGVFDDGAQVQADGFGVLHGLSWLVANLAAEGPLLLAVDDAQWCDGASLRFLGYLARRLASWPVVLAVAVRTDREPGPHDDLLAELALEPDALVLHPAALSEEATARLVEHRLEAAPDPSFAAACHRTTSGNPLLLSQLLRALATQGVRPDASHADTVVAIGSRAISSMVLMRLRRLPEEAAAVARAVAVLGGGAALPQVAALAELSEQQAARALAALARAELVNDVQPATFVHPLVRDAVYQALPAAERGLRHEQAARVLRSAAASDEQVAAHLLLAPARGDEEVVALLVRAGRAAAGRGASDSAVTYLRRALAESPHCPDREEVLLQLGLLEAPIDGVAAVEHLVQADHEHTDPRMRAEIAIAAAATQVFASPPGVATAFAREAAAALPEELSDHRQALLALQRMSGFMHALDDGWRTPGADPEGEGPGARMLAATVALRALLDGEDRERCIAMARFALDGDVLLGVDDGLFWVNAAAVRILSDDDVGDFWDRARRVGQARGSLFAALSTSLWEGFWRWRRGDLFGALACLRDAHEQDLMWGGARLGEPFVRGFQVGCHLDRGDVAEARRAADAMTPAHVRGQGGQVFQHALAQLLVAEGRYGDALAALDHVPPGIATANPVWNPRGAVTAMALQGLGRNAEALETAQREVTLLRRWGAPSYLGRGLVLLGELLGNDGLDVLREAVALLAGTSAAVDLARAQYALGSRHQVRDDEAVPLLLAAGDAAARRGAYALNEAACAELRRRGHPVDPRRETTRPLSPTERQVLELTHAGLGVDDVSRRLFLTPETVRAVLAAAGANGATPLQVSLK